MTQLDDDRDGVSNAADMCLNSSPGRLVDASGCAIINQTDEPISNQDDSSSLTTALFILAAFLLLLAGVVASNGRVQQKQTQPIAPPKRPANLDEAIAISAEEQE
jgi:hypothetical protein